MSINSSTVTDAAAAPASASDDTRMAAIHALEAEFGELMSRFRRIMAEIAERVSPGMLPGVYKVFSVIARRGTVTSSQLAETLGADKGQISRAVRELEQLGFVERQPDPTDGRASILSPTDAGVARLAEARGPQLASLMSVLADWSVDDIEALTGLLHALTSGERPQR